MIPPELLLRAYQSGLFPMGVDGGEIGWFSPDPRGIIPLDTFHVPKRLARVLRQARFSTTIDQTFDEVINACARTDRDGTWINAEIIETFSELHRLGFAHSVETHFDGRLAGGLYGVALGGVFFGESMFSHVTDASKIALNALVTRLRTNGYRLLDIQWVTTHLEQFGAVEIRRAEYLRRLAQGLAVSCAF